MALIAAVSAYFLIIVTVLVLWLAPGLRARLTDGMAVALGRQRRSAMAAASTAGQSLMQATSGPVTASLATAHWIRRHALWLLLAALVLAGLPLASLGLRQWHRFDGFDHTLSREVNPQIAALLAGEQLVAPKPLPPALFMTPEVELALPRAATASREWALLDPDFRQRLLLSMQLMRDRHGIEVVLLEGYRSEQRQAELVALGPAVTMAGPGSSYHQVGLAADCAFLFDGKLVISEKDPRAARAYALYGDVAQSTGLVWGGAWREIKDLGHVELRRPHALKPRQRAAKLVPSAQPPTAAFHSHLTHPLS